MSSLRYKLVGKSGQVTGVCLFVLFSFFLLVPRLLNPSPSQCASSVHTQTVYPLSHGSLLSRIWQGSPSPRPDVASICRAYRSQPGGYDPGTQVHHGRVLLSVLDLDAHEPCSVDTQTLNFHELHPDSYRELCV